MSPQAGATDKNVLLTANATLGFAMIVPAQRRRTAILGILAFSNAKGLHVIKMLNASLTLAYLKHAQ
jgi:hypothetical protein